MSDWTLLEKHRVNGDSDVPSQYWSTASFGFCGMFRIPSQWGRIRCVASDGMGWKHVSVSIESDKRPPKWETMCFIKDLFFEPNDWVVQYHPAQSEYVNHHPGCLHLWMPTNAKLPTPDSFMVGPKTSHKYATARRDGYDVPLIGVPKSAEPSQGDFRDDPNPA